MGSEGKPLPILCPARLCWPCLLLLPPTPHPFWNMCFRKPGGLQRKVSTAVWNWRLQKTGKTPSHTLSSILRGSQLIILLLSPPSLPLPAGPPCSAQCPGHSHSPEPQLALPIMPTRQPGPECPPHGPPHAALQNWKSHPPYSPKSNPSAKDAGLYSEQTRM